MEEDVLENLGLSRLEVKVYIALLTFGDLSVIEISRKTKLRRTYIYEVLESLIEKGLVSFITENKTKKFKASNPEKILHQLKEKEAAFMEVLPNLKKRQELKEKKEPSVEVFRGTKGMKGMASEILEIKKDYCLICEDIRNPKLLFFENNFMKLLEKEKLRERVLVKKRADIIKSKNTSIRFLPDKYPYHSTTIIYSDRVGIIIWSEPFIAIRIQSKELADTYRSYFEIMWEVSKE